MNKTVKAEVMVHPNAAVVDKSYTDADAIASLNSRQLAKQICKYVNAKDNIEDKLWVMAYAIRDALTMINNDFSSATEFAKFMNLSNAKVSKMTRVADMELDGVSIRNMGFDISAAYELLPLYKKGEETLQDFFDKYDPVPTMSKSQISELVKEYKQTLIESTNGDSDAETNDKSGEEDITENETGVLTDLDNTEEVEFAYTLPTMTSDGAIDVEVELTFSQMESLSRLINEFLNHTVCNINVVEEK